MDWECINIIQTLRPSPKMHSSRSGGPSRKAAQYFLAPHEMWNPTLIPIWTAISESLMSPAASDKLGKKSAGPEFGFGAGTVGLKDLGASYPPHRI